MDKQQEFQKIMIEKFTELKTKNNNYSLRSFAKRLSLSPAAVSEILRGRRNVSSEKMEQVLGRLHLNPEDIKKVVKAGDQIDSAINKDFRQLNSDQYFSIADGYHFAILSLIETESFDGSINEISRRLGLSRPVVTQAIDRLERLGLIELTADRIKPTGEQTRTPDDVVNLALQKAHRENLELAIKALEEQPVSERDFTSLTFAIDPKDLPLLKKRIRNFLGLINKEFESRGKKKVYRTTIQLFNLEKENL